MITTTLCLIHIYLILNPSGADVNETAATATGTSYSQLMDLIVHQAAQEQLNGPTSDKGLFVVSMQHDFASSLGALYCCGVY